jgi:hypothetical protein
VKPLNFIGNIFSTIFISMMAGMEKCSIEKNVATLRWCEVIYRFNEIVPDIMLLLVMMLCEKGTNDLMMMFIFPLSLSFTPPSQQLTLVFGSLLLEILCCYPFCCCCCWSLWHNCENILFLVIAFESC